MEQFWAACEKELPSNARSGMVWRRQVHAALTWVLGFLRQQHGPLIREWKLSSYTNYATVITITFDASPWGLGGWTSEMEPRSSYLETLLRIVSNSVSVPELAILADNKWQKHWLY